MRDGKANAICVDSVHSVITLSEKPPNVFVFCVFYGSLSLSQCLSQSPLLLLYIILTRILWSKDFAGEAGARAAARDLTTPFVRSLFIRVIYSRARRVCVLLLYLLSEMRRRLKATIASSLSVTSLLSFSSQLSFWRKLVGSLSALSPSPKRQRIVRIIPVTGKT